MFPWLLSCWLERMSSCALWYELVTFKTAQCRSMEAEKFSLLFSGVCRPGRTQECQRGLTKELEVQVLFPLISVASFLSLPTHQRNQVFSLSLFLSAKLKKNICEKSYQQTLHIVLCKYRQMWLSFYYCEEKVVKTRRPTRRSHLPPPSPCSHHAGQSYAHNESWRCDIKGSLLHLSSLILPLTSPRRSVFLLPSKGQQGLSFPA